MQERWPRGTPVAPSGRGPGGGRFRSGGADWASIIFGQVQRLEVKPGWRDRERLERGRLFKKERNLGDSDAQVDFGHFRNDADHGVVRKLYEEKYQANAEWLTSLVGEAIGAPVPPATKPEKIGDRWAVYLNYAPGDPGVGVADWQDFAHTPGAIRLGLLDALVGNIDRHDGNWLLNQGEVIGIDHGQAFRYADPTGGPPHEMQNTFVEAFMDWRSGSQGQLADKPFWREANPLTKRDVERARLALEPLRHTFYEARHGEQFETILARLNKIGQFAHGTQDVIA